MKAISLWEPWASAMALGLKTVETRSWPTAYRGQLIICSAKRIMGREEEHLFCTHVICTDWPMPIYGCALCAVELYDMLPTNGTREFWPAKEGQRLSSKEEALGDYSPGRWMWITRNCRRFKTPFPVTGRQGLFELSDDMLLNYL